jgi:hypothetical protein
LAAARAGYAALVADDDFELLAASLRADAADLGSGLEVLARKLEGALPGRVRVERGGLLRKGRAERLECDLGEGRYTLAIRHGRPDARRATVVRGVTLKSEELGLDQWIEALARELAADADRSADARAALEKLLS